MRIKNRQLKSYSRMVNQNIIQRNTGIKESQKETLAFQIQP